MDRSAKMNENLFKRIKSQLNAKFYVMNDSWLRDCVEFFVRGKTSYEITDRDIFDFVESQWQLSDLQEISNKNGCLPKNLAQQVHTILTGTYILQVNKMYDIASSKYKQLCEIRKTNSDNLEVTEKEKPEWEPKARRMMQLCLTDGVQHVTAIEYSLLKQMTNTLLPGYKVMIIGPVSCRRGIILLEYGKYKEIGGEVDCLLKPNALENVLARALGEPENLDPYHDSRPPRNQNNQNTLPDPANEDSFFDDDFEQAVDLEAVTAIEQQSQQVVGNVQNSSTRMRLQKPETQIATSKIGEEFLEDIDFEPLEYCSPLRPMRASPTSQMEIEEKKNIMIVEEMSSSICNSRGKQLLPTNSRKNENNTEFPDDDFDFDDYEIIPTEKLQRPISTIQDKTSTASTSKAVEQTSKTKMISKFLAPPSSVKICDVLRETIIGTIYRTVRGQVKDVSPLTKEGKCWIVTALIADHTSSIEVCFDSEILERFLGFTVQEFLQKKKLAKSDPQVESELRLCLRKTQHQIQNLDALLKLELTEDQMPKIIGIIQLIPQQKEELMKGSA